MEIAAGMEKPIQRDISGAFCLYNGGFTAGFTCFLFIPVLEHFCKTKQQRKELKAGK